MGGGGGGGGGGRRGDPGKAWQAIAPGHRDADATVAKGLRFSQPPRPSTALWLLSRSVFLEVSPMLLGCADGVSQIEASLPLLFKLGCKSVNLRQEFGLDASELPRELLAACEAAVTSCHAPAEIGIGLVTRSKRLLC